MNDLELFGLRIKKNKLLAIFGYSSQQHVNIFPKNWFSFSVIEYKKKISTESKEPR